VHRHFVSRASRYDGFRDDLDPLDRLCERFVREADGHDSRERQAEREPRRIGQRPFIARDPGAVARDDECAPAIRHPSAAEPDANRESTRRQLERPGQVVGIVRQIAGRSSTDR